MIAVDFFLLLFIASAAAGVIGAIVGLGGGVLIVPILTLIAGVDIHYAVGASIVSVIATSSGAAATYVKDKITNLRVGTFLLLATTVGAIIGAAVAIYLNTALLEIIFGGTLMASLIPLVSKLGEDIPPRRELKGLARRLALSGTYTEIDGSVVEYNSTRTGAGLVGMFIAGLISGLLGIGSGTFKVLSMDIAMRLPMKVSSTTSNFMIGVTAAASAGIYFMRGVVNPFIAAPVSLGVLLGATLGTRLLLRARNPLVRKIFAIVLAVTAVEMILRAFGF